MLSKAGKQVKKPAKEQHKTGPDPERVKIDKPWEEAVNDALKKKRPADGWPDHSQKPAKKKPQK